MTIKFTADQFTATQWDSAADKARFANHFVRFVQSDFKRTIFPKWFYNRLSMTFGHIAHTNIDGFYVTFFNTTPGKIEFLEMTFLGGFGDPEFTYSDVERVLAAWVREEGLVEQYRERWRTQIEFSERTELARPQAKYGEGS